MPPAAFLHPKNVPKSLAAGASPQTPQGDRAYSAPPDPLAGLKGLLLRRREGKGGKGRGGTLDPHNVGDRLTPLYGSLHATATSQILEWQAHRTMGQRKQKKRVSKRL